MFTSARNLTPSSTGLASPESLTAGTAAEFQRLEHGQLPPPTVTVTPEPGASTLPLSSIARLRMVMQNSGEFRKWLRTPHDLLDKASPLDLLAKGERQAVADYADDMLTGAST